MTPDLIVVDDFYGDPDAVRRLALGDRFHSGAAHNYPGWQSHAAVANQRMADTFGALIGRPVAPNLDRFTWGAFRLITGDTGRMVKIHADTGVDWAAMVYLTPDADPAQGTGFFRHRETGLTGPPTERAARLMGYADRNAFEEQVARRDMAELDRWELVTRVAPKYNRLVLFRGGRYYHAPLGGAGATPETSRLTHSFFFDEAVPAAVGGGA
jgi:hypothetical protein